MRRIKVFAEEKRHAVHTNSVLDTYVYTEPAIRNGEYTSCSRGSIFMLGAVDF